MSEWTAIACWPGFFGQILKMQSFNMERHKKNTPCRFNLDFQSYSRLHLCKLNWLFCFSLLRPKRCSQENYYQNKHRRYHLSRLLNPKWCIDFFFSLSFCWVNWKACKHSCMERARERAKAKANERYKEREWEQKRERESKNITVTQTSQCRALREEIILISKSHEIAVQCLCT